MAPEELRNVQRRQPFEPFRIVMTDGTTHDIRHPDLLMVGLHAVMVGLTSQPDQTLYERTIKLDLLNISHIEPLTGQSPLKGPT